MAQALCGLIALQFFLFNRFATRQFRLIRRPSEQDSVWFGGASLEIILQLFVIVKFQLAKKRLSQDVVTARMPRSPVSRYESSHAKQTVF